MASLEDDSKPGFSDDFPDEDFESLYRPAEGIVENIKQRALALLGLGVSTVEAFALPVAPVLDAIDSCTDDTGRLIEKMQSADHESAHLLLGILNDFSIFHVWMSQYGRNVAMSLGLPKAFVATSYFKSVLPHYSALASGFRDLIDPKVLDASKLSDTQIVRHIFVLLAGYLVNVDSGSNENDSVRKMMNEKFVLPAVGGHDVSLAKQIFASTKYKEVMNEVFDLLLEKIIKFLNDPLVRKVIDVFSSELLEKGDIHAEGEEVAPMMVDLLEKKGVGKADFEKLHLRYEGMVKEAVSEMKGFLQ